jgi:DNA-binding MurR/RpiR family transcriptional regulator
MDAVQSLVQKSTTASIQALKDTSQLIDIEMLEKAVALLTSQKRIVMYGASMSGNTAEDARNRFLRIGVVIEVYTDAHMQAMSAATLTKDDLAIGISISGSTKDTIDALRIAKNNGAKVISLTHSKLSPITHLSDVILLTAGRETPLQGGSMGAKISQLLVIDLLYNLVANQRKNEASRLKELTSKAVLDKAY